MLLNKSTIILIIVLVISIIITHYSDKLVQDSGFFDDKEKNIKGIIISDPEIREKSQKFIFVSNNGIKIIVFVNRYLDLNYGDNIELKGNIEKPEIFNTFDYPSYLYRKGIFYVSYFPNIKILSNAQNNIVKNKEFNNFLYFIYNIKNKMRYNINKYLPEPNASLVLAGTIGDSFRLDDELNTQLVKSGLRHIVAVSGLHMSIILGAFFIFFITIGLKRSYATISSLMFLFFYVVLTGMPFSVIRASIMGVILFLGFWIGRPVNSINTLIIAAIGIIFWQNEAWQDVSFQLSFLAVLGILLFFKFFKDLFIKIQKIPKFIINILSVTMSVLILIWPILAYNFGEFSIIAPISNILVLPILPILMILSFFVMVFGMFLSPIAIFFSWFLWLISEYVILVAKFLGGFSFSTIIINEKQYLFIILYYCLLLIIWYLIKIKKSIIENID